MALWVGFAIIVGASLVIDLVTHRNGHGTSRRAAIGWTFVWIGAAVAFAVWIGIARGRDQAEDFAAAYLMEKSLSIDNLFVFLVVFSRLKLSAAEQHRVLSWGILGALVFRGVFIAAGSAVITRWHEVVYVLGAFLVVTGVKTLRSHTAAPTDAESGVMTFVRERLNIRSTFLLAVFTIELTDILFAVDSVPAVFAVTSDPFIVYTSNVFAILGLRALYLVLADLLGKLRYMHVGLAAILILAGVKMLVSAAYHVPHAISLGAIVLVMAVTVVASIVRRVEP
jgi:tellurite resistance protein TerC